MSEVKTAILAAGGVTAAFIQALGYAQAAGAVMLAANVAVLVLWWVGRRTTATTSAPASVPITTWQPPLSPRKRHLHLVTSETGAQAQAESDKTS
jgi:hypothetical protein